MFLAIYFDWRMAIAAIIALIHDLVITIGVYSILQFEVTPSTMIGILTILGYSLYDTVVVFDKVKENTRGILGQSRQTYSQAANLAVNQTLVRSINTSVVALLPVGAILFVGAGLLGAGTLKDLSLALFVGIAAGAYSSVFIATPFLAQLMERNPQMQALARRVPVPRRGREGDGRGRGVERQVWREARRGKPAGQGASTPTEDADGAGGSGAEQTAEAGAETEHRGHGPGPRTTDVVGAAQPAEALQPGQPALIGPDQLDPAGSSATVEAGRTLGATSRRSTWPIRRPCPSRRRWREPQGCARRLSRIANRGPGAPAELEPILRTLRQFHPQSDTRVVSRPTRPRTSCTGGRCAARASPTSPIRWRSRRSWPTWA